MKDLPIDEILERLKKRIDQVRFLRDEVTYLQETLFRKNVELDFLHYVWCSGGCEGGMHRYFPHLRDLTEDQVEMAVESARLANQYAQRLLTYYHAKKDRERRNTRIE